MTGIDSAAVEAYDQFYARVRPLELATAEVRLGLWRRAWVVPTLMEELPGAEETEVAVAGGGPAGLLFAAGLAQRGHHVVLLEARSEATCCSTWNLSVAEFADLRANGVLPETAWDQVVLGRFERGFFRLYDSRGPQPRQRQYHFDGILNVSLDAHLFTKLLRKVPNLTVRPGCLAELERITRSGVYIRCEGASAASRLKARLFVDARGWTSPLARLVHPWRQVEAFYNMVGVHVQARLPRETEPGSGRPVGLICVTYENEIHTSAGWVQPILERFSEWVPDKIQQGEVLYYFTRTKAPVPLRPLLNDMAARLGQIAPGFSEEQVDATYYGHCPGYYPPVALSRFGLQTSAGNRTLLVGCAAQQYSGLTGCAFGPLARNVGRMCAELDELLRRDRLSFRRLNRVNIDPRERISQTIEELFSGAMLLSPGEPLGTVNGDWIAFNEAADQMDQRLKNEAFRDKIQIATLNQLVGICAGNMEVLRALLRNNRGRVGALIWTFLTSYLYLLLQEFGLLARRWKVKYLSGTARGVAGAPLFLWRNVRLACNARRALSAAPQPATPSRP